MSDTDCERCVTVSDGTRYLCEEHRANASGIDWEEMARRRERNVFEIVYRDGTTEPADPAACAITDEFGNIVSFSSTVGFTGPSGVK